MTALTVASDQHPTYGTAEDVTVDVGEKLLWMGAAGTGAGLLIALAEGEPLGLWVAILVVALGTAIAVRLRRRD